jgi:hypothetical protein
LANIYLPFLTKVGSLFTVFQNALLSSLTIQSLSSVAGSVDIDTNQVLTQIDISALQTVSGDFSVRSPILDILKAGSLRNVTGYLYVSRCVQPDFALFVDAFSVQASLCNVDLGDLFVGKKAVVCVPCQPQFYKAFSQIPFVLNVLLAKRTSNAEASNCFPIGSSCAAVTIPDYGCKCIGSGDSGSRQWCMSFIKNISGYISKQ